MPEAAHIAEDFMIGNTRIKIATDACEGKTANEIQAILDDVAKIALSVLSAAESRKRYEQKKMFEQTHA